MDSKSLTAAALGFGMTGGLNLESQFSHFPYNFGQTKWARQQRRKVAAMRKAVRNDEARIAAAAAKRGRRMRRNQLGFGTGREA